MRFFVPSANDPRDAEERYRRLRDRLAASIGPVSERRIYRLKFEHDGTKRIAMVGSDRHGFGSAPVCAIFEGSDGSKYVLTQNGDAGDGEPHPIPPNQVIETEDFSALA